MLNGSLKKVSLRKCTTLVSDDVVGNCPVHVLKTSERSYFEMFVACIKTIVPWMFSLDHVHYARWLLVYL